jgi:hypothetical protein
MGGLISRTASACPISSDDTGRLTGHTFVVGTRLHVVSPRYWDGLVGATHFRVRYSCLKEAAGEEASMQIQWCCGDEKDSGNR